MMRAAELLIEPEHRGAPPSGHLSGWVVGQLRAPEQFVLWALRQRAGDARTPSPSLIGGFRLAFSLAYLEAGLAAFEALYRTLTLEASRGPALFPLRCACISADERAIIELVGAVQAGNEAGLEACTGLLAVGHAPRLHRDAAAFARLLLRAELSLPAAENEAATLH